MRLFSSILFLFLGLLGVKAQQISYLCSDTLVASITATCTDGTGPYTYEWENPSGDVVSSDEINLTEVSRTATSIRFRLLGASTTCGCGAAHPVSPVCGVTIVNAMMRLVGRDACNNVVFDRIFLKYNNN